MSVALRAPALGFLRLSRAQLSTRLPRSYLISRGLQCAAAGFAGNEHAEATQAVLAEYQSTVEAATQKTNATKAESKAALQKRLGERRKRMEAKTQIAMQKIAELEGAKRN